MERQRAPKRVFFAAVIVVFFCTLSVADSFDFVPYYLDGTPPAGGTAVASGDRTLALADLPQLGVDATSSAGVLPARIEIPAAGIDLPVQNPATTDVNALDNLLKNGPARYADSAKLGTRGNVIIFAHSSHLPIVRNKMFQAFNNIPDLKPGENITLVGADGTSYLYSVESVKKEDVSTGATIDLTTKKTELTLVTCDTLTGVSARFVLTASYIGTAGK